MNTNPLTSHWHTLPEPTLRRLQAARLREYLANVVLPFSAHYRELFREHNLSPGDFATLVTYGEMVSLAEEASEYFHEEYERGIEVFDLRALAVAG